MLRYGLSGTKREIISKNKNKNKSSQSYICSFCSSVITLEALKVRWFQPQCPHITIGPYCEECFKLVRICHLCNKPKEFGVDIEWNNEELNYICNKCSKN